MRSLDDATSRKGKQLIYGRGVTLALGLFLIQTQWEADELTVTLYPIISFPQDDPPGSLIPPRSVRDPQATGGAPRGPASLSPLSKGTPVSHDDSQNQWLLGNWSLSLD